MSAAPALAGALVGATVLSVCGALRASRAARVRLRLPDPAPGTREIAAPLPILRPPRWLGAALDRAGVTSDADSVWRAWMTVTAGGCVLCLAVGGPALAVLAAVALILGPVVALRVSAGRGARLLEASLPELLEHIARSLRSGTALLGALGEAGRDLPGALGADVRSVVREVEAGAALTHALDRWGDRRPLPAVGLVVAALALGAETGGAQAQALDGLATTLRDRLAVAAEVRALSSQARLSALVITAAPVGFAVFAASADPRSADFLLRTPLGLGCLTAGLLLDGVAAWWMHRLTRKVA